MAIFGHFWYNVSLRDWYRQIRYKLQLNHLKGVCIIKEDKPIYSKSLTDEAIENCCKDEAIPSDCGDQNVTDIKNVIPSTKTKVLPKRISIEAEAFHKWVYYILGGF